MRVTELFIKPRHDAPMQSAAAIACSPRGIAGNAACAPFRQALIVSRAVTTELGLKPGDLRENIVVDCDDLYDLPSGTVVKIGEALIRLTFHCEPCKKILHLTSFDQILHKRGFLGCFLNSGTIAIGDPVTVTGEQLESIPYAVKDRVRWFFTKQNAALAAIDLAHALGLPSSYARAIPRLVESFAIPRRSPK